MARWLKAKAQGLWVLKGGVFFWVFFLLVFFFFAFPWFSYEKTCFLLFLGFSSGKQQFLSVVDGFGVIFRCFPTKKHSLVLDFPSGKHSFS